MLTGQAGSSPYDSAISIEDGPDFGELPSGLPVASSVEPGLRVEDSRAAAAEPAWSHPTATRFPKQHASQRRTRVVTSPIRRDPSRFKTTTARRARRNTGDSVWVFVVFVVPLWCSFSKLIRAPALRPPRGQQRKSFRAVNMKARRCPRSAVSNKNRACNCIASVLQPQSGRDVKAQVAAQLYEEALSRPVRAFFGSRFRQPGPRKAAPGL